MLKKNLIWIVVGLAVLVGVIYGLKSRKAPVEPVVQVTTTTIPRPPVQTGSDECDQMFKEFESQPVPVSLQSWFARFRKIDSEKFPMTQELSDAAKMPFDQLVKTISDIKGAACLPVRSLVANLKTSAPVQAEELMDYFKRTDRPAGDSFVLMDTQMLVGFHKNKIITLPAALLAKLEAFQQKAMKARRARMDQMNELTEAAEIIKAVKAGDMATAQKSPQFQKVRQMFLLDIEQGQKLGKEFAQILGK